MGLPRAGRVVLGCAAVGLSLAPVSTQAMGAAPWIVVPSPNGGAGQNNPAAVACVTSGDCWAVGQYDGGGGTYHNLVLHGAGDSWSLENSANTSDTRSNGLNAVTCVSAEDCWAVGYAYAGANDVFQTLIEHRTAGGWSVVSSPLTPAVWSFLYGVACTSADACWAVGWTWDGVIYQTLVEKYGGGTWSIVHSPNPVSTQAQLVGVACADVGDCWAVGSYLSTPSSGEPTGVLETLVEHYDGTGWSTVPSPNPAASSSGFVTNTLNGVACAPGGACWAAGWYADNSSGLSLILENSGAGWSVVGSPNQPSPGTNDQLAGITCATALECYAVGSYYDRLGHAYRTLVEQWNGADWTIAPSADVDGSEASSLLGVSCVGAGQCRAVGVYSGQCAGSVCQPATRTLVEKDSFAPGVAVPEWPAGSVSGIALAALLGAIFVRRRARLVGLGGDDSPSTA